MENTDKEKFVLCEILFKMLTLGHCTTDLLGDKRSSVFKKQVFMYNNIKDRYTLIINTLFCLVLILNHI